MAELEELYEVKSKGIPTITTKSIIYEQKEIELPQELVEYIDICVQKCLDNRIMQNNTREKYMYKSILPAIGVVFSLLIMIFIDMSSINIYTALPFTGGLILLLMNLSLIIKGGI